MEDIITLTLHHSGHFVDSEKTDYVGGKCIQLDVDVDRWSYFELVGVLKDLGYTKVATIYYKDPQLGMSALKDDKGANDVVDLFRVHLEVHIFIEHVLSQPEFIEEP